MSMTSLVDPSVETAIPTLRSGLKNGAMLTVVGQCEVEYKGRAESYLPFGDRLVILKPDGTLLVHRSTNQEPVNWQPPGCNHSVQDEAGQLVIETIRSNPKESVRIAFQTLLQVSSFELANSPDLLLEGSEEDLRQRILADPCLIEDGFAAMMTERETAVGSVDIFGKDRDDIPTVVELKRRRVGPDAVGQLSRYVDALNQEPSISQSVRGILVAPSVTDRAAQMLQERNLQFVALEPH